eukprot:GHVO01039542.1.p1 GENE.GHVO01039542.1~~GHVO01039542.1.p1  ORF type:complete len:196 (+),score=21.09 GHVO01039542.1:312-899(+)
MGAATALMYADRDPSLAGLVCDSSFASFRMLIDDLVETYTRVKWPKIGVNAMVNVLRNTVKSKAGFDIDDLVPLRHVPNICVPGIFVAATSDKLIQSHHSRILRHHYAGDAKFLEVSGNHNSERAKWLNDSVSIFLIAAFRHDVITPITSCVEKTQSEEDSTTVSDCDEPASRRDMKYTREIFRCETKYNDEECG